MLIGFKKEVLSISSFIVIVCDKKKFKGNLLKKIKCMDGNFVRSAFIIFNF